MSSGEADAIHVDIRPAPADAARRVIAITGIPGSGKTTLAGGLAAHYGYRVIGTGDISRMVDPASLSGGGMADESLFQAAFRVAMDHIDDWSKPVIIDGLPRRREQITLLPYFTTMFGLTCRPDIARDRLLRRARPDDTEEIVARRVEEQSALLDIEHADGWMYQTVGWGRVINTSVKPIDAILHDVIEYLDGRKRQAF